VGGSGAGKSCLADKLRERLKSKCARISLDDFYRDRSHLSPARRRRINFDHPRAIDWDCAESVLRDLLTAQNTRVPRYNFKNHSRKPKWRVVRPRPVVLMDGLWLLRRPSLERLFGMSIYIECPARTRLSRRLARDLLFRGRSATSIRNQFHKMVEPMNAQYVVPQSRKAHIVIKTPITGTVVRHLAGQLLARLKERKWPGKTIKRSISESLTPAGNRPTGASRPRVHAGILLRG
jgi:uridine kinase